MITPRNTNDDARVAYFSTEQVLRHVVAELMGATADEKVIGGARYWWPVGDQTTVYVADLPTDCSLIELAIREYAVFVDGEGYLRFPISEIEINRKSGSIRIIGDPSRIAQMRPLPSSQPVS